MSLRSHGHSRSKKQQWQWQAFHPGVQARGFRSGATNCWPGLGHPLNEVCIPESLLSALHVKSSALWFHSALSLVLCLLGHGRTKIGFTKGFRGVITWFAGLVCRAKAFSVLKLPGLQGSYMAHARGILRGCLHAYVSALFML